MAENHRPAAPPQKVLFATDLSARCDRALDRAVALASAWQADLIAVHALEQSDDFYAANLERRLPSWRRLPDVTRIVEDQIRHDMMQIAPNVVAVVEKGEPTDVVLRAAADRGCDLIVTGIARDETLGRFGLGATVDRLVRRTNIPLLIVRQRVRAPYGNILVATDFSSCSECALAAAMAFFPDRRLAVFHAYEAPFAGLTADPSRYQDDYRKVAAADCAAFLTRAGIPEERQRDFDLLVEHGAPADLLHRYVQERGVDLVVLGTHGRSALMDIVLGSTARDILSALPCDVLVARQPGSALEGRKPS